MNFVKRPLKRRTAMTRSAKQDAFPLHFRIRPLDV
jgi:hypothetical protein